MDLEGTLNYLDVEHLLRVLGASRKTGVLRIWWEDREARLYLQGGRLIRAESNRSHQGIGTLLVEAGVLAPEELEAALAFQRGSPDRGRLGAILCDRFGVRGEEIQAQLRAQFEGIVYEVFSWPGGRFSFRFQEPAEVLDPFHLNPVEFILQVGIQTGLLATAGVEREQAGRAGEAPLLMVIEDPEFLARCSATWQERDRRIVGLRRAEEAVRWLDAWRGDRPLPVVAGSFDPAREDSQAAIRALGAKAPLVVLGTRHDPEARNAARRAGAGAYVPCPTREQLTGAQGASYWEVFTLQLERALSSVTAAAQNPDGKGTP